MPDNLYNQLNQSVLIDVDGVVLAPMGEFIINAPSGFSEVRLSLPRGAKSHGFSYEFSDVETPFGFDKVKFNSTDADSPYSFIKTISEASGVDAAVMFEFRARKESTDPFETQYLGDLDFEEVEILDLMVNLTSRRKNLDDLFRTRQKTKVSFGATESIDGETITGLVADDVFLHSKVIIQSVTAEYGDEIGGEDYFNGTITSDIDNSFQDYFNELKSSEFNSFFNYADPVPGDKQSVIDDSFFRFTNETDLAVEIKTLDYNLIAQYTFTPLIAEEINGGAINHYIIVADELGVIQSEEIISTINIPSEISPTPAVININLASQLENIFLDKDWSVYAFSIISVQSFGISVLYNIAITSGGFDAKIATVKDNSITKAYKPFEATNHILEVINNREDMLISSFITDEVNEIYQTNGYSIRGFDSRPPETSFDDQFYKWLQPMFGVGFAVVLDGGLFKVLIERYSHFYRDVEIDYFDTINDGSWSITADKSVIFNEFEVGYSKFPSSTDENKQNTIDEFNTLHGNLSPIKTVEKKATYKSDAIGSGYLLENSRREQFKEVPSDTVTNDDSMFLVKTVDNDLYTIEGSTGINAVEADSVENTIKLLGTYFDIQISDVINLNLVSGGSPIENNYTVSTVTIVGGSTLLLCVSVPITGTSEGEWEITLPEDRLRAERDENMDVLTGVISPETSYNVGLNPKNMLFNQSPLFNSGFHPKLNTAEIKTQTVKLNGEMESQFAVGEGGYVLDPDRQLIKQNQTVTLLQTNQNIKLFTGRLLKFTTTINYDRVLLIRDACLNVSTGGDNYGYIRVKDPFGVDYKGFIMNMEYNPLSEEVDFELREKFD